MKKTNSFNLENLTPEQKKNINPVCEKSWTTIWVLIKITEKARFCWTNIVKSNKIISV